jgi:hypothetical protein
MGVYVPLRRKSISVQLRVPCARNALRKAILTAGEGLTLSQLSGQSP